MGRLTETVKFLIIINVIFFGVKLFNPEFMDRMFSIYYFENPNFKFWQPVTHMFMHADMGHILFNMFGLFMFGSPLEQVWGRNKFLFFYFSAGIGATLIVAGIDYFTFHKGLDALMAAGFTETQVFEMMADSTRQAALDPGNVYSVSLPIDFDSNSYFSMLKAYESRALGASGAVYGVLVAYGLMYPNREIMMLFLPIPIKAKYFIPIMIIGSMYLGVTGQVSGVGHFAHVGGALFGFIMAYYWKKNSMNDKRWD